MNKDSIQEKRQSKRYLCNEFFSHIKLQILEVNVDVTAIDFNKEGMGLFSNDVIPESGNISISLLYESPSITHKFYRLPCSIVHCNLTEVGSHFGLRFKLNEISKADCTVLEEIESYLIQFDDPDDRYHLFGDD